MKNFVSTDKNGNVLTVKDDNLSLKMASGKSKQIGLYKNGNYYKGVPKALQESKHKFRKCGANGGWGISYLALQYMDSDKGVFIYTDHGKYFVSKKTIITHKNIKHFSKQGYELQYIVPQELMTKF